MKNKIFVLLLSLLLLSAFTQTALAADGKKQLLYDKADVLTEQEEAELSEILEQKSAEAETDIVLLAVNELENGDIEALADESLKYGNDGAAYGRGEAKDCVILVYKHGEEGDRKLWLSANGDIAPCFSEDRIDEISEDAAELIRQGSFKEAFSYYAQLSETFISEGPEPSDYGQSAEADGEEIAEKIGTVIICFLLGFLIMYLILRAMTANLKSVKSSKGAGNYIRDDSFRLTQSSDNFLYKTVTRREIRNDDDEDSFGGRMHGGHSGGGHSGGGHSGGGLSF